jgi:hypothetical protein
MQYHLRYCLHCLADQETDERGPCTDCGSIQVTALTYNPGTVILGDGDSYTEYGTARPWQEQWYQTKVHFRELKAVYQPGSYRGDAVAKAAVEDFFEHCLRVEDWVKGDAMDCRRGERKLKKLFNDHSLKLCRDIANTAKHRGRNLEGSRNAVVCRVYHRGDNSASAVIEWWMQGQEEDRHTEGALDLAEGCVAAWKQFLKRNELRLWEVRTRKNYL